MSRMVKISDVAREAGVSVATVSRSLNNHVTVNPELAARVREAAERLGYRPNGIARSLRRQSTDVLALIISDVANPFFTAITRGVEDVAQRNGFSVLLCNADEQPEKEATYLRVAEQEQVAGVLLSPHSAATDISRLRASGIPVVIIDRPLGSGGGDDLDSVMVESAEGARVATAHLLAEGWQRPGCVTGPADAATAEQRLAGYRAALADAGIAREFVARAEFRQAGGRAATAELLGAFAPSGAPAAREASVEAGPAQPGGRPSALDTGGAPVEAGLALHDEGPGALDTGGAPAVAGLALRDGGLGALDTSGAPVEAGLVLRDGGPGALDTGGAPVEAGLALHDEQPDSLFVANSPMALGMLEELASRGLRVGVDLGVVVFDDAPWAPFVDPPMTVIAQPAYEIGATAAQLLVDRIRGTAPHGSRSLRLDTTLEIRASSRRPHPTLATRH
jgi:LacI family transcriptional regulator